MIPSCCINRERKIMIKNLISQDAVRFGLSLLDGFSHPYTAGESQDLLHQGIKERAKNFLSLCEREIFYHPENPYFLLFHSAGTTLDRLKSLVEDRGLEPALSQLAADGIYLDIEEFKGKKPVVRGGLHFSLDNSLLDLAEGPAVPLESSGSSGRKMKTPIGLDGLRLQASFLPFLIEASGLADLPVILYYPMPSTPGVVHMLAFTLAGRPPAAFFSHTPGSLLVRSGVGRKLAALVVAARLRGVKLPLPQFADVRHPKSLVNWLVENCAGGACVATFPGSALHLIGAARILKVKLPHLVFILGGEPTTKRKRAELEADGHRVIPWFGTVELGRIAIGCLSPSVSDDMHLLSDRFAAVKRKSLGGSRAVTIEPFLFTSLSPAAHKLLINVETGDSGTLESRRCGCPCDRIGFDTHLHSIESFEKLNMEGMTFDAAALAELVEETLPAACGGTSADFQFAEEEGEDGLTRLVVSVNPSVEVKEEHLKELVLEALYATKPTLTRMTEVIRRAETIVVRREYPRPTSSGKVNPLRREKN